MLASPRLFAGFAGKLGIDDERVEGLFLLGAIQHLVIPIDRAVVVVAVRPAGGIEHREAAC